MKRIIISENLKVNGKSCRLKGDDWEELIKKGHEMNQADCFQHYNSQILDYIKSRI